MRAHMMMAGECTSICSFKGKDVVNALALWSSIATTTFVLPEPYSVTQLPKQCCLNPAPVSITGTRAEASLLDLFGLLLANLL